ncbi:iron ABC transporter substrate-binding protein [Hoyosella rhizosphaerae]|uniref:Iron ABC transporter substrate-binding protein n=1 Tax=Hoyosella rhizosphaerae TaxID=1755582 RepID=A0A916UB75_9ACTN|nr:iron ABC transporter substrate-binding protein [Hoyosella rhizosphaerae]MBN4926049.1 iron ABC transporter substrate-binding protein [Hoyosella rhizosphaerae]GGC65938.1 iron ABC transporter substrate-binding protein [Hoyosella rhizosphaerae]
MITRKRFLTALTAVALAVPLAACSSDETTAPAAGGDTATASETPTLVMYSGRGEDLVDALVPQLEELAGVNLEVRYGNTAELAAQILEEGDRSPADIYFSQDAGALGAVARAGLLAELDEDTLNLVPEAYQASDGTWVSTSGRARVIVFNSEAVDEADVPDTIDALLDPEWRGKIGFAPTNASWQAFVTALRVSRGEEGAREWLEAFRDNEPVRYEKNGAILTAVEEGQVELGLINHYYWYRLAVDQGLDNMRSQLKYLAPGDEGALVNIAGAGVLASSENQEAAQRVVRAMLSLEAQEYFLDETSEYPLIDGLSVSEPGRPQLDELQGPDIDLADLESLEETQELLTQVGLL